MSSPSYNHIGFIGLGAMGIPMVGNLLRKLPDSCKILVYDVSKEAMAKVAGGNSRVRICGNSKEVAEESEVIISMVPEGSHVRSVYLTPETSILAANVSGKLLVDCSTIDTATSLEVRDECLKRYSNASFYDAPVSGGALGAEKGTLTFMVGCSEEDSKWKELRPLLGLMGSSIIACGGPSFGLTAKLCNNYCSALIAIATSEAMDIGMRAGMDPRVLASVFKTSTAQSAIADKFNPVPGLSPDAPPSHGYKGGFKVQLMKKDFGLAVDTAKRVGAKTVLSDVGLRTYEEASSDSRCKDLDSRVVYRYLGGREDWMKNFGEGNKL
ncbi:MAG: hypothetical protein M1820_005889 [Bogoriella megaspora]|nr:MAG: hypothetical protein M1820_005889 [Bogoriella megaspora]